MGLLQFQPICQIVNMLQTRVLTLGDILQEIVINSRIQSAKQKLKFSEKQLKKELSLKRCKTN